MAPRVGVGYTSEVRRAARRLDRPPRTSVPGVSLTPDGLPTCGRWSIGWSVGGWPRAPARGRLSTPPQNTAWLRIFLIQGNGRAYDAGCRSPRPPSTYSPDRDARRAGYALWTPRPSRPETRPPKTKSFWLERRRKRHGLLDPKHNGPRRSPTCWPLQPHKAADARRRGAPRLTGLSRPECAAIAVRVSAANDSEYCTTAWRRASPRHHSPRSG
jgi:hypothetical protein